MCMCMSEQVYERMDTGVSSYVYVYLSLNCVRQQKASEAMGLLGLGYMRLGSIRTG